MAKVHFVGGEKGGVGKSLTARLLGQYLIDQRKSFVGFDSDRSHPTFTRFYRDFTHPLDVSSYESLDQIVEAVETNPSRDIIIDLAAQTADQLNLWMQDSEIIELLTEMGQQVYLWHVMDDGADSVRVLEKLVQDYGDSPVQLVVVRNWGRGEDFSAFEDSSTYDLCRKAGARFISIGALQPKLVQKIDFNNQSFWAAANNRGTLTTAERQRVKVWLRTNYEQIAGVLRQQNHKEQPESSQAAADTDDATSTQQQTSV